MLLGVKLFHLYSFIYVLGTCLWYRTDVTYLLQASQVNLDPGWRLQLICSWQSLLKNVHEKCDALSLFT